MINPPGERRSRAAVKNTVTTYNQKVVELQVTWDLFGRLRYISTVERNDFEKVFHYPLTPITFALARVMESSIKLTRLSFYTSWKK